MYVEFQENHVLYYEGDKAKKFYIIIDGKIDILEEKRKAWANKKRVALRERIYKRESQGETSFNEFENSIVVVTLSNG